MESREKIKTVIIHSDEGTRKEIELVSSRVDVLNVTDTYADSTNYQEHQEKNKHEEPPQLILVGEKSAVGMSKILRHERNANLIVVTNPMQNTVGELQAALRLRAEIANLPNFYTFARTSGQMLTDDGPAGLKSDLSNVLSEGFLKRKISELARERKIEKKLKVGLFGLGRFGNRIVQEIVGAHWLSELYVSSNYLHEMSEAQLSELPCKALTNEARGGEKVKPLRTIEELIAADVDILLTTEGPNKAIYGMSREEYTERNLPPTWAKVEPIVREFAKNPKGLLVMLSHPPGPCADLAHLKYGIPPGQITSFPIDMYRAQQKAFNCLRKKTLFTIDKEDMPLDVIGGHGEDAVVILRNPRMPKYLGEDVFSVLSPAEAEEITAEVRDEGRIVMESSRESGINYLGAPRIVAECLDMIAHYRTNPHFSWYSQLPARKVARMLGKKNSRGLNDMYLMFPTSIEHVPLNVRHDGSFDVGAFQPNVLNKLRNTIIGQQRRVNRLLKE